MKFCALARPRVVFAATAFFSRALVCAAERDSRAGFVALTAANDAHVRSSLEGGGGGPRFGGGYPSERGGLRGRPSRERAGPAPGADCHHAKARKRRICARRGEVIAHSMEADHGHRSQRRELRAIRDSHGRAEGGTRIRARQAAAHLDEGSKRPGQECRVPGRVCAIPGAGAAGAAISTARFHCESSAVDAAEAVGATAVVFAGVVWAGLAKAMTTPAMMTAAMNLNEKSVFMVFIFGYRREDAARPRSRCATRRNKPGEISRDAVTLRGLIRPRIIKDL